MAIEPCAVIWDVDGTLVDTAQMHFDAWVRLAGEMGRPFSKDDFAATFGRRNPEIIRYLFREEFTDLQVAEIGERKENYYRAVAESGVELLPGVRQLLEGLHQRGVLQAVGSSAPRANLDLILKITKSDEFFEAIVGMEDTTRGKPDPEVFLVAAKKLGIPLNRCIVFEDAVAGVQAAKAGGMKCVAVTFAGHHPAERLREAGADCVVKCFTEVTADEVLAMLS
jgi:beta-phosphoglucomutase